MIVDAHHHFWDPSRRNYPWMGHEVAAIRRRFGPDDLRPELAANGVDKTVLVQTVSSLDETREFLANRRRIDHRILFVTEMVIASVAGQLGPPSRLDRP